MACFLHDDFRHATEAPSPFLDSIASSCFHMSGTACDAKAATKEAVANLEPVRSETMCILPLTRCAEDALTDALHVFSKRSEVLLEITNCAYQVTKVEHYYCLSLRPTVSPRRENSKCHQVPIFPDQNKGPTKYRFFLTEMKAPPRSMVQSWLPRSQLSPSGGHLSSEAMRAEKCRFSI